MCQGPRAFTQPGHERETLGRRASNAGFSCFGTVERHHAHCHSAAIGEHGSNLARHGILTTRVHRSQSTSGPLRKPNRPMAS